MKQGMLITVELSIIGFFVALLPIVVLAEETPQSKTKNAPAAKQPEKSAPTQTDSKQTDVDQTWKEQLEQKHVQFIEWLQENYPDKAKQLLANRDKKPDEFVQALCEVMKIYEPIQRAEQDNPELAKALRKDLELQDQRDQLLREIAMAKDQDRPALLKRLKEIVSARFDNIIHKKHLFYDHLRRRLEKLQEKLEAQAKELEQLKAEKDQSVEQRMKELTEQAEKINWE
ncbi:MAG: hypothetical protein ISS71_07225 [Phycisphaerae bacterium]|nr:hypothetical protein [Phycisphaerae bacterium]